MGYTKAQREAKAKLLQQQAEAAICATENTAPAKQEDVVLKETKPIQKAKQFHYDLHDLIPCINGTQGYMIYVSSQTKEQYEWHQFGDVVYMELAELLVMKRTQIRFFVENMVLIEDMSILKYLHVEQYYANAVTTENFDSLFSYTPDEISAKVATLSDNLKSLVIARADKLIKSGAIDSRKKIIALQNALGVVFDNS